MHSRKSESIERITLKKNPKFDRDLLSAIDESPEFHDPYSDLNLFLSQKIKREMRHCSNSRKWSPQLQDELLHKITPEFQQRFPKYRLGVTALKKTWEKVQYFSNQIQEEKEALTQDGKLNLSFFIKENLKSTSKLHNTCHVHPCHYAHQLAVKMSECIAVVDGIRPKLEQLTRTIWSLQRHLIEKLSPEHFKSPYDENEQADKLIVKAILEITAKHPSISQAELTFHVQKHLTSLRALTSNYTPSEIKKMLTALFADVCHFTSQRMERTLERIPYPTAKYLKGEMAAIAIDSPQFGPEQVVEEAFSFFEKASQALSEIEERELERKIQNWTIQSDMLLRWIRLNPSSALLIELEALWNRERPLEEMVEEAHHRFMEKYPHLLPFAKDLKLRTWIYVKYLFFIRGIDVELATFDRFILWHKKLLEKDRLPHPQLLEKIEKICKTMLPLIPFSKTRAHTTLIAEKENQSHDEKGQTEPLTHVNET